MKPRIPDIQQSLLAILQDGLALCPEPYTHIACKLGITPAELFRLLESLKAEGKLRRIGVFVNHFRIGLGTGAMVAWQILPEHIERIANTFAGINQVSHVYERYCGPGWPYNLYTMIHCSCQDQLREIIEKMSRSQPIIDFRVLATKRELKKTSPVYA